MSTAKKLKASQKAKDKQVITLRGALFTDSGDDKDVTAGIAPAFMKVNSKTIPQNCRSIYQLFISYNFLLLIYIFFAVRPQRL
jgi:hypothetical protein